MMRRRSVKKEGVHGKFIGCSDLHAEKNRPRYRKDNYWETWQEKMKWVIDYANKNGGRLLIAGDLFNTCNVYSDVTNVVMSIFSEASEVPIVVPGQHDLKNHTNLEKTPLFSLELAGVVKILRGSKSIFTGAGFEEEIPKDENTFLITHTCITPKKPPFFLEDAISSKKFMRLHPGYKIIISGDYHVPFHTKLGDRHLINCGTLIRNKKDMKDYKPYIWDIDIDGDDVSIKQVEVPHKPYGEVFDTEAMEYDENHGISLDTNKLKEIINTDIEIDDVEPVIWIVYNKLKEEGMDLNEKLVQEVIDECL